MQTELMVLIFVCCCLRGGLVSCDDQLVYKLTNIECEGNPERAKNISCSLKAVNWNKAIVNMDCCLTVPLRNPVVHLKLLQRDYSNQWKPFLVDVSVKISDLIYRRSFLPYGVLMWKIIETFTNINRSLPISGHIYTRNGYFDSAWAPPFPIGLYQLRVVFVDKNDTISEYVGSINYTCQVMVPVRSKKRPRT